MICFLMISIFISVFRFVQLAIKFVAIKMVPLQPYKRKYFSVNQLTGLCMIETSVMKELTFSRQPHPQIWTPPFSFPDFQPDRLA